jgi:hypothetical protein
MDGLSVREKEDWKGYGELLFEYSKFMAFEEWEPNYHSKLDRKLRELREKLGGFDLNEGESGYLLHLDMNFPFWSFIVDRNPQWRASVHLGLSDALPIVNRNEQPLVFLASEVLPDAYGSKTKFPYVVTGYIRPFREEPPDIPF